MMVCCDYAKLQEPTGWGQLLSESIGFQAMAGVFMPASFVVFTDWQRWRNGEFKFVWSKPFHLAPEKRVGSATVLRTLSFWRLSGHAAKIAFWTAVHKYLLCSIDIIGVVIGPTQRILTDHGTPMDWVIICFTCYTFLVRFTLFYVIFYELSRLVGDFQQFLLSPAFSPNTLELVRGDPLAAKFWKQASLVERWIRVEVTVECLMPEGPCCTMIAFTSSEIWRFFDTGLYNVLKHYIYIPWMEVVTMVTYGNKDNLRGQTSPVVQNIAAVFGAVFTFLFVLTFHGWNKGNYVWVTISFVLWMIERFVAKANRTYALSDNLSKRLGAAWEQRIRCAACSGLQMINLLSFSFFVTSYDSAWFLVDSTPARPCKLSNLGKFLSLNLSSVISFY
ncbi:unnamed protein product [Mesocestoides corti]|uniref:Uncharacterized protein n=1 Tax=Mesocestoides corti TaxID=53468 RepID=A0A0R3U8U8_MESCO|nr:unnamed protein product [Mesocestoides corti]